MRRPCARLPLGVYAEIVTVAGSAGVDGKEMNLFAFPVGAKLHIDRIGIGG